MAVTSTNRLAGPYIGTGSAASFPFGFKVFQTSDLEVIFADPGGNEAILTLGTDYTAALFTQQDVTPGGTVTLTGGPLASGYRLAITSNVPELQQVVLTNLGGFYPELLNTVFDRLTILIQQIMVGVNRSIKFGITDPLGTTELPPPAQRAGKFLYFGADGGISLLAQAPTGFGTQYLFAGTLLGSKDGSNKVFTLSNGGSAIGVTPLDANVWNNYQLIPGVGYVLGPTPGKVTFTDAPSPGDSLFAKGVFIP